MDNKDLDALLGAARLPESTVPLCLRGDLQAEWETLERQLAEAKQRGDRRLVGSPEEAALARQLRDLEAQMQDSTITLRLRALPRREFMKLVEKHPARKDNQVDRMVGVNQATFYDALIGACIVEPEIDEERLTRLLDALTDAQFNKLANTAWELNRSDVSVPFSRTASRITTNSDET